jgi:uncharacterized protein (TIGR00251 family)
VADDPFTVTENGVLLAVRLTPRAGRTGVDGVTKDAAGKPLLAVRVKAPPVEGAANAALVAWLADALDLRKSDITFRSGETARIKLLHLAGDGPAIASRIAAMIG